MTRFALSACSLLLAAVHGTAAEPLFPGFILFFVLSQVVVLHTGLSLLTVMADCLVNAILPLRTMVMVMMMVMVTMRVVLVVVTMIREGICRG